MYTCNGLMNERTLADTLAFDTKTLQKFDHDFDASTSTAEFNHAIDAIDSNCPVAIDRVRDRDRDRFVEASDAGLQPGAICLTEETRIVAETPPNWCIRRFLESYDTGTHSWDRPRRSPTAFRSTVDRRRAARTARTSSAVVPRRSD